jgi:hypothetical protein
MANAPDIDVEELTSNDVSKARKAIEYYFEKGWTDGLPIVPPIDSFVDEFLARTKRSPDEVVLTQQHLHRACTVRHAAINAVMAGCLPEYFPTLLAAIDATQKIDGGRGMMQSTTGQALLLFVNGPVRNQIELNCTNNIFGSGDRANATIGRAMRLITLNVLDIRPHDLDQSTHGTPAKYTCCLGENEEESPWQPYHVDKGYAPEASAVTAHLIRSDLHVEHRSTQTPEHILHTIADSLSYAGAIYEAPPYNTINTAVVAMGPEHAIIIASKGWSKQAVREFLYENWGRKISDLKRFGKVIDLEDQPDDAFIKNSESPDSISLVVTGASNAGVSTVCMSFVNRIATAQVEEA